MEAELVQTLKYLRLGALRAHWEEYLAQALKGGWSPVHLLKHVLEEEAKLKREHARERRLKQARIPEPWVMETFPFDRQRSLDKKKILSIYDAFEYVAKSQNLIWVGPTGCGKTGLGTGFLIQAINRGHTGRSVLFRELVAELFQSTADHSEEQVMRRYLSYECLLVDELGYVEAPPEHLGLFFALMHKRHRHRCTLVTSSLGFDEWRTFLKNDQMAVALIDRLTENSHVINMRNCVSLRPKLKEDA